MSGKAPRGASTTSSTDGRTLTSTICPFTLKPLSSIRKENLAVIYQCYPLSASKKSASEKGTGGSTNGDATAESDCSLRFGAECGHSCDLSRLVSYLHDGTCTATSASTADKSKTNNAMTSSSSRAHLCPVCLKSPVVLVCDALSSAYLTRGHHEHASFETRKKKLEPSDKELNISHANGSKCEENKGGTAEYDNDHTSDGRIVTFRYGSIFYCLWVDPASQASSSYYTLFVRGIRQNKRSSNALERVSQVLGMDIETMKVIHKGKVIFPDNKVSKENPTDESSEQILDISSTDLIHHLKKPSLVVTGLRQNMLASKQSISNTRESLTSLESSSRLTAVVSMFTPLSFRKLLKWLVDATVALFSGIWLFATSLWHPPEISDSGQTTTRH